MLLNELKAVIVKTNDVAFAPLTITAEVPSHLQPPRGRSAYRAPDWCPIHLIRGKILDMTAPWSETRPVSACGDQEYTISHKNGILIETTYDDLIAYQCTANRSYKRNYRCTKTNIQFKTPHGWKDWALTQPVKKPDDDTQYVHMIVSFKVIFASWGEYALKEAQREKDQQERIDRDNALRDPQAALFGLSRDEFEARFVDGSERDGTRYVYLQADYQERYAYTRDGNYVYDGGVDRYGYRTRKKLGPDVGRIQITVDQANHILSLLTDEQKAQLSTI